MITLNKKPIKAFMLKFTLMRHGKYCKAVKTDKEGVYRFEYVASPKQADSFEFDNYWGAKAWLQRHYGILVQQHKLELVEASIGDR